MPGKVTSAPVRGNTVPMRDFNFPLPSLAKGWSPMIWILGVMALPSAVRPSRPPRFLPGMGQDQRAGLNHQISSIVASCQPRQPLPCQLAGRTSQYYGCHRVGQAFQSRRVREMHRYTLVVRFTHPTKTDSV